MRLKISGVIIQLNAFDFRAPLKLNVDAIKYWNYVKVHHWPKSCSSVDAYVWKQSVQMALDDLLNMKLCTFCHSYFQVNYIRYNLFCYVLHQII